MSNLSFPRIAVALVLLLALGLGGAFLKLGMNPPLPVQTVVHKDLPGARFALSESRQGGASLPAMPEPKAAPMLQQQQH
ncbi:hypothetical protein [Swaminathania salitolerans]|uniref:Uncharacterized protein n=1 Tax=Swaminathania salitolerans TaxID=182838 RepID=A0A511BMX6_9PROT|nr:hypothetical protein [Swaminathania salitolerans]GBQ15557.1 hypothetical protein AA21291_2213 [Swaminathania salitolerans LMG 21291]GEL01402.1 hypothetical protein SSA02_05650 [Swaminathania salitolerans]